MEIFVSVLIGIVIFSVGNIIYRQKLEVLQIELDALKNNTPRCLLKEQPRSCKKHEWISMMLPNPKNEQKETHFACINCGSVQNQDFILNIAALKQLQLEYEMDLLEKELDTKAIPLVAFEMSRFYDLWITQNKDILSATMQPKGDVKLLHETLNQFLIQGHNQARYFRANIIKEFEDQTK